MFIPYSEANSIEFSQILFHTDSASILAFSKCFLQSSYMDAEADKSTVVPCRTRYAGPVRRYTILKISIHHNDAYVFDPLQKANSGSNCFTVTP